MVELLVAMVVMIVIMLAVLSAWSRMESTYTFTNDDLVAQAQSRIAMSDMVESIRTSQLNINAPAEALKSVIPVAKDNEIWLWVAPQGTGPLRLVSYRVDSTGGILYREQAPDGASDFTSGSVVQKLVTGDVMNGRYDPTTSSVRGPLFSYYDANGGLLDASGNGVADPTQIREVHIDLLVDIATPRAPIAHELTSIVQPRNLRQY